MQYIGENVNVIPIYLFQSAEVKLLVIYELIYNKTKY